MANDDIALDWDSEVSYETAPAYTVLTPGQYRFRVTAFERKRYNGSTKLPPCPMAELELSLSGPGGEGKAWVKLFLTQKQAWKSAQFFKACSLIPEDASMDGRLPWGEALGAEGACKVGNREYNGKEYNEVTEFLKPSEAAAAAPSAPSAPAAAPKAGGFGGF